MKVWRQDGGLVASTEIVKTTDQARREARCKGGRIANTHFVQLKGPCTLESGTNYTIEHSLKPTDVTNHFSGYPITNLGAELWTCYGIGGQAEQTSSRVKFFFSPGNRGGRSCVEEGQLPFLHFWIL